MIDLTYYNNQVVTLQDIHPIAVEAGFIVTYVEQFDRLQIEVEPKVVVLWEVVDQNEFDELKNCYTKVHNIKTIHQITLYHTVAPQLQGFLLSIFKYYGGWIVDDETPNFSEMSKGRVDVYDADNISDFLKTLT